MPAREQRAGERSLLAPIILLLIVSTGAPAQSVAVLIGAPAGSAHAQHRPGGGHGGSVAPVVPAGETTTLKPGMSAPAFELTDQEGVGRRLADYRDRSHVPLVFYMGQWCMGCMSQLTELAHANANFAARGVQILAVSVDGREKALVAANRLPLARRIPSRCWPIQSDGWSRHTVCCSGTLSIAMVPRTMTSRLTPSC